MKAEIKIMANKSFKFRIYPNVEQKILFVKTFGCVRLVYNYYLDKKIKLYQADKSRFSYTQCSNDMTALKKTEEYIFLSDIDSIALQQSLRHLDDAFKNFLHDQKQAFQNSNQRKTRSPIQQSAQIIISKLQMIMYSCLK